MTEWGYALSAEEHPPNDLVRNAARAEEVGFTFALISDHFHPWVDAQGNSAFVWSVIGGIAQATERLRLGTGVTCPTIRIHPAIIAHAAATSAAMMPGRFFLGVGSGENLNEHITGEKWPTPDERLEMFEESIEVIRQLWQGGYQTYRGEFYDLEQARLYDLPDQPIELAVAAAKPLAAELAGRVGDGLISTAPDDEVVQKFKEAGGEGKPIYGQVTVCVHEDEAQAKKIAREVWPNAALKGDLSQELPLPMHFDQATQDVTEEQVAESVVCGTDVDQHLEKIRAFEQAGFTHVYVHQVGSDQEPFFDFYSREIMRRL